MNWKGFRKPLSSLLLLIVICSPLSAQIDHWEALVLQGDNWRYLVPTQQPDISWKGSVFDDSGWSEGPSGIGYGDGDDATVISSTISVYMRLKFEVSSTSAIDALIFAMDYDDGFVAYLNGTEISRALVSGDHPGFDQISDGDHEALLYQGIAPETFTISKDLLSQGTNILAVEVHNRDITSSDLSAIPFLMAGIKDDVNLYRPVPDWFNAPAPSVAFESSNLPIVIIETINGQEIPNEPKIGATMHIINHQDGMRNHVSDLSNPESLDFSGPIQIEYRGSSSSLLDKKQYALTTYNELNEKDNVSLLGMPKENDWILNGLAYDPSLMRDFLSYRLSEAIGQYASRGIYCEVVLNGDYRGIYILQEKLKADDNRININKIESTDNTGPALTGGYITKSDKTEGDDFAAWEMPNYSGWNTAFIHEHPKPTEITSQQDNYVQGVFNDLAAKSANQQSSIANGYPSIIDIPSFIDFIIINELAANVDGYQFSTFFHKDRNGKLRAGPVWDFNLTYGNDLFFWGYDRSHTDTWQFFDGDNVGAMFWKDLMDDPVFACKFGERWHALIQPGQPLHVDAIYARIDQVVDLLAEARVREQAKWNTLDYYDYHIAAMKTWIADRINWISDQTSSAGYCPGDIIPPLVISAINYHPQDIGGIYDNSDYEFIGITNTGTEEVDLTGIYFGGTGLVFQFPANSTIDPGNTVYIASSSDAFRDQNGFRPFGEFNRKLDNGGQHIELRNGYGSLIDEVNYDDEFPWPIEADGDGFYLKLTDVNADNHDPLNWQASIFEYQLALEDINESMFHIYPNPASDELYVETEKVIDQVTIRSLSGINILYINSPDRSFKIPISGLSKGVYLIELQSGMMTHKRKIVIQ